MGKKRGGKGRAAEDDWETESVSTVAESTWSLSKEESGDKEADEFGEALDWTFESRGSTREKGFNRLAALMRSAVREVRGQQPQPG